MPRVAEIHGLQPNECGLCIVFGYIAGIVPSEIEEDYYRWEV